jgi:hypothetical protein
LGGSIYYYDLGNPVSQEKYLVADDMLKSGPNPATDYYFIDYKAGNLSSITVSDFSGRIVSFLQNIHTSHYELPLDNLLPGV